MTPTTTKFDARKSCNARRYVYYLPTFVLAKHADLWDRAAKVAGEKGPDFVGNFEADLPDECADMDDEGKLAWHARRRSDIIARGGSLDSATIKRLNEALAVFVGSHKFHNYTRRLRYEDEQSRRLIREFYADDKPHVVEGLEFVRITVVGQSFLYNQIRKMIGMAIEVTRRELPRTLISDAFGEKRVDVPKAPAEGLFLACPYFEPYNNKVTAKGVAVPRDPLDFDEPAVRDAAEAFAADNLVPFIAKNELAAGASRNMVLPPR